MRTIGIQEFQKINSIRERKIPDKSATDRVNSAEHYDNKNDKSSVYFDMEVLSEGTFYL